MTPSELKKKYEHVEVLVKQRDELVASLINVQSPKPSISLELLNIIPKDAIIGILVSEINRSLVENEFALFKAGVVVNHEKED